MSETTQAGRPPAFSGKTRALLSEVAPDLAQAIEHAPDEVLQQVSGGYRATRQKFDEPSAKRLMQADVMPERVKMLEQMIARVADPKLREYLVREHAAVHRVVELLQVIEIATAYKDAEMIEELLVQLVEAVDLMNLPMPHVQGMRS